MQTHGELRAAMIRRGEKKHGDLVWIAEWQELWGSLRDELVDAVVWAWVLSARAEGYGDTERQLVRHETAVLRDRMRRCWHLAGHVLPPGHGWQVPGCSPERLSGLVYVVGDPVSVPQCPGFVGAVRRRVAHGRAKYGDRSFAAPGRRLVAEIAEELVAATLWLEIAWRRVERAGMTVGETDREATAELLETLTNAYRRLPALELEIPIGAPSVATTPLTEADAAAWARSRSTWVVAG